MNKKEESLNSLLDIQKRFPTEQSCRDFLEEMRWHGRIICTHCGHDRINKYSNGKTYFCVKCRKQFTVKVGTIFEDSALPLQKWFFAMYLMTAHKKGVSSHQLSRDIGVTQKTAWHMEQRIRNAMKSKSFLKPLNNVVEADETYIGGKHKGKRGRGSENKTAVFGMAERNGEVRSMPVEQVNSQTLKGLIRDNVSKDAMVITDEWMAYNGLDKEFQHERINHGRKEYVNGNIHVNNIENFWSLLKRGILGIYHHVSPKHLHRYCNEFQFRYNSREIKDTDRFKAIFGQCEGRLMYQTLIGK